MKINMNKTITIRRPTMESLAVLLMCLYTLFMYLIYTSEAIASVNSLVLYAFLGCAALTALFRMKLKLNRYLIWYLGFVVLSTFAAVYAPHQQKALSSLYNLLVVFGLAFAMTVVFTSQKRMELFMRCLVVGSVILTLYLRATGQLDIDTEAGERLGNELTGNANGFAAIYMVAACSSVYFVLSKRSAVARLLYWIAFFLQMFALTLSGGRKFFLVPLLLIYLMMLQKQDKKGRRHIIICTAVALVCAWLLYSALLNVPLLYDTVGHRFESLFDYTTGISQTSDASTMERARMRERAYELWLEAPLFGHGFDAFSQIGGWGVYSHCNYLELLCNQGIIGFLFYYAFWLYLLVQLIRAKSNHPLMRFFIGLLACFLIYDYGAVSYNSILTHAFILMACLCLEIQQKNQAPLEENYGKNQNTL